MSNSLAAVCSIQPVTSHAGVQTNMQCCLNRQQCEGTCDTPGLCTCCRSAASPSACRRSTCSTALTKNRRTNLGTWLDSTAACMHFIHLGIWDLLLVWVVWNSAAAFSIRRTRGSMQSCLSKMSSSTERLSSVGPASHVLASSCGAIRCMSHSMCAHSQ